MDKPIFNQACESGFCIEYAFWCDTKGKLIPSRGAMSEYSRWIKGMHREFSYLLGYKNSNEAHMELFDYSGLFHWYLADRCLTKKYGEKYRTDTLKCIYSKRNKPVAFDPSKRPYAIQESLLDSSSEGSN